MRRAHLEHLVPVLGERQALHFDGTYIQFKHCLLKAHRVSEALSGEPKTPDAT